MAKQSTKDLLNNLKDKLTNQQIKQIASKIAYDGGAPKLPKSGGGPGNKPPSAPSKPKGGSGPSNNGPTAADLPWKKVNNLQNKKSAPPPKKVTSTLFDGLGKAVTERTWDRMSKELAPSPSVPPIFSRDLASPNAKVFQTPIPKLPLSFGAKPMAAIGGIDTMGNGGGTGPALRDITQVETEPETLEIWDTPSGKIIVPAGAFTPPGGATKTGDLTDPDDIAAAKGSSLWWEAADPGNTLFTKPVETTIQDNIAAIKAKESVGIYDEPKDMPGYNTSLTGISTRLSAKRAAEQRAADDAAFKAETGFMPPTTSPTGDPYRPLPTTGASIGPTMPKVDPLTGMVDNPFLRNIVKNPIAMPKLPADILAGNQVKSDLIPSIEANLPPSSKNPTSSLIPKPAKTEVVEVGGRLLPADYLTNDNPITDDEYKDLPTVEGYYWVIDTADSLPQLIPDGEQVPDGTFPVEEGMGPVDPTDIGGSPWDALDPIGDFLNIKVPGTNWLDGVVKGGLDGVVDVTGWIADMATNPEKRQQEIYETVGDLFDLWGDVGGNKISDIGTDDIVGFPKFVWNAVTNPEESLPALRDKVFEVVGDVASVLLPEGAEGAATFFVEWVGHFQVDWRQWQVETIRKIVSGDDLDWKEKWYAGYIAAFSDAEDELNAPGASKNQWLGPFGNVPFFDEVIGATLNLGAPGDFGAWYTRNKGDADVAYQEAYDAAGGGEAGEKAGDDAVWELYESTANVGQRLVRSMSDDPLNALIVIGAAGKLAEGAGIGIRLGAETAGKRLLGRTIEGGGRVVRGSAEIGDNVAGLGADYALRGAAKLFQASPLGRPSKGAALTEDLDIIEGMDQNIIRRKNAGPSLATTTPRPGMTPPGATMPPGATTPPTGPTAAGVPPTPPGATTPPSATTPPAPTTAPPSATAPPPTTPSTGGGTTAPKPRPTIAGSPTTPTAPTTPASPTTPSSPAGSSSPPAQPAATSSPAPSTTASTNLNIPARWHATPNPTGNATVIDVLATTRPDVYDAVMTKMGPKLWSSVNYMGSLGKGQPHIEHAIESTRILGDVADEIDRSIDTPIDRSGYADNSAYYDDGDVNYRAADEVMRANDWDGVSVSSLNDLTKRRIVSKSFKVGDQPSIQRANRFVDMMENADRFASDETRANPRFQAALKTAQDLKRELTVAGERNPLRPRLSDIRKGRADAKSGAESAVPEKKRPVPAKKSKYPTDEEIAKDWDEFSAAAGRDKASMESPGPPRSEDFPTRNEVDAEPIATTKRPVPAKKPRVDAADAIASEDGAIGRFEVSKHVAVTVRRSYDWTPERPRYEAKTDGVGGPNNPTPKELLEPDEKIPIWSRKEIREPSIGSTPREAFDKEVRKLKAAGLIDFPATSPTAPKAKTTPIKPEVVESNPARTSKQIGDDARARKAAREETPEPKVAEETPEPKVEAKTEPNRPAFLRKKAEAKPAEKPVPKKPKSATERVRDPEGFEGDRPIYNRETSIHYPEGEGVLQSFNRLYEKDEATGIRTSPSDRMVVFKRVMDPRILDGMPKNLYAHAGQIVGGKQFTFIDTTPQHNRFEIVSDESGIFKVGEKVSLEDMLQRIDDYVESQSAPTIAEIDNAEVERIRKQPRRNLFTDRRKPGEPLPEREVIHEPTKKTASGIDGVELDGNTYLVDPARVKFDEKRFQPRQQPNENHIRNLADKWNALEQDPIRVIASEHIGGEKGTYTVVSGHHRTYAAQLRTKGGTPTKLKFNVIEVLDSSGKVDVDATITEARRIGLVSNLKGVKQQLPIDTSGTVRGLREIGMDDRAIASELNLTVREVENYGLIADLPGELQAQLGANYQYKTETDLVTKEQVQGNAVQVRNTHGLTVSKGADLMRAVNDGIIPKGGEFAFYNKTVVTAAKPITDAVFRNIVQTLRDGYGIRDASAGGALWDLDGMGTSRFDTLTELNRDTAILKADLESRRRELTRQRNSDVITDPKAKAKNVKILQDALDDVEAEFNAIDKKLQAHIRKDNADFKKQQTAAKKKPKPVTKKDLLGAKGTPPPRVADDVETTPDLSDPAVAAANTDAQIKAGQGDMFDGSDLSAEAVVNRMDEPTVRADHHTDIMTMGRSGISGEEIRIKRGFRDLGDEPTGKAPDESEWPKAPESPPDLTDFDVPDINQAGPGFGPTYVTIPGVPQAVKLLSGGFHKMHSAIVMRTGNPLPVLERSGLVVTDAGTRTHITSANFMVSESEVRMFTKHSIPSPIAGNPPITMLEWKIAEFERLRNLPENAAKQQDFIYAWASMNTRRKFEEVLLAGRELNFPGVKAFRKILAIWDSMTAYRRERALYSWPKAISYPTTQFAGNLVTTLTNFDMQIINRYLSGTVNPKSPIRQALKSNEYGRFLDEETGEVIIHDPLITDMDKAQNALGSRTLKQRNQVYKNQNAGTIDPKTGRPKGELMLARGLRKVPIIGKGLAPLAGSRKIGEFGSSFDGGIRESVGYVHTVKHFKRYNVDFKNHSINQMEAWGLTRVQAQAEWNRFKNNVDFKKDAHGGMYDMNDIRKDFKYLTQGQRERLARDWQNTVYKLEADVRKDMNRITFTGPETRADLILKRLFLFHHFFSRQSFFYASQMAKNPGVLNAMIKLHEYVANDFQEDLMPDRMKGWMDLWFSPFGREIFLNPGTFFSTWLTWRMDNASFDVDRSDLGDFLFAIDKFGINPWIMDIGNFLGVNGKDFVPDPLGIYRENAILNAAINWSRAHGAGGDPGPVPDIYKDAMSLFREKTSGEIPGTIDVPYESSIDDMNREIQILMVDEGMRQGMTEEEATNAMLESMGDPDSELYQQAVKRWANGEVLDVVAAFLVGPFRPRSIGVNSDGEEIYSHFNQDTKNAVNTAEGAIAYKKQSNDYYSIETDNVDADKGKLMGSLYGQLRYGTVMNSVEVGGVTYTPVEINAMTEEQRGLFADAYFYEQGWTDDYWEYQDARDAFLEKPENAEFAQYQNWSKGVREYGDDEVDAYWEEVIQKNPSAKEYYQSVKDQDLLPWEEKAKLTNMSAWMAVNGIQQTAFDPEPSDTSTVNGIEIYDPLGIAGTVPKPNEPDPQYTEKQQTLVDNAPRYLTKMMNWNDAAMEKGAEMFGPRDSFDDYTKGQKYDIDMALKDEGVYEPSYKFEGNNEGIDWYIEWAMDQPAGADVSPDAYFRSQDKYNQSQKSKWLADSLELDGMTPDQIAQEIFDLMEKHNHERYKK